MAEDPTAKSLRWLANMFPYVENPGDDETDRWTNLIHMYCTAGADRIDELNKKIKELENNGK